MGARDMYEFWQDTYKVHHIEWSPVKAAAVIEAWQKRFSQELARLARGETVRLSPEDEEDFMPMQVALNRTAAARLANFRVVTFSSAALDDLLSQFSELSIPKLAAGYLLMVSDGTLAYNILIVIRFNCRQ
jgi:patched 1 protein